MRFSALALTIFVAGFSCLHAQTPPFDSGSNGSYGPINITENTTLQVPPDGIFHCTTVRVANNRTLRFTRNSSNTPVYILATGDVVLESGAVITVSGSAATGTPGGLGGPGGGDGGDGASGSNALAGAGKGPGGGSRGILNQTTGLINNAGNGSHRVVAGTGPNGTSSGQTYGSPLLIPLVGGSGGGGLHVPSETGLGGGGGGGAILIASNTRITGSASSTYATISANGGVYRSVTVNGSNPRSGGGSGGSIRLIAPVVSGQLRGETGGSSNQSPEGEGRFRVDAYDVSGWLDSGRPPQNVGRVMIVFPPILPKLLIANAAGTAISENTNGPVSVFLPAGTNPSQTIQIRARDFGGLVPIRVRLVPEGGDAVTFDATIDNTVTNPATVDVPVTFPVNTGVRVEVFTR